MEVLFMSPITITQNAGCLKHFIYNILVLLNSSSDSPPVLSSDLLKESCLNQYNMQAN